MTESAALKVSLAYYSAWTAGDLDTAMGCIAEDIVCWTPAGRLEGAAALRCFMEPFARMLLRSELVASFGDERIGVLVYDADTRPVTDAPGAEVHTVTDGRISELRIIFDRLPFEQARAGQQ